MIKTIGYGNYSERRQYWTIRLGGKCVHCGSVERGLAFHHRKPSTKTYNPSRLLDAKTTPEAEVNLLAEMDKCVLLCPECHSMVGLVMAEKHGGK